MPGLHQYLNIYSENNQTKTYELDITSKLGKGSEMLRVPHEVVVREILKNLVMNMVSQFYENPLTLYQTRKFHTGRKKKASAVKKINEIYFRKG